MFEIEKKNVEKCFMLNNNEIKVSKKLEINKIRTCTVISVIAMTISSTAFASNY